MVTNPNTYNLPGCHELLRSHNILLARAWVARWMVMSNNDTRRVVGYGWCERLTRMDKRGIYGAYKYDSLLNQAASTIQSKDYKMLLLGAGNVLEQQQNMGRR